MAGSYGAAESLIRSQTQGAGMNYKHVPGVSPSRMSIPSVSGMQSGMQSRLGGGPSAVGMSAHDEFLKSRYQERVWTARGERFAQGTMRTGKAVARGAAGGARMAYGAATSRPARMAYGAANMASTRLLGASIPQIGAVAGLGALAYAAMADDPVGDVQAAGRMMTGMGEQLRMASRPSYGHTAFQQSVQGLTFGLHSSRTRY